jgi:hypothetical protein
MIELAPWKMSAPLPQMDLAKAKELFRNSPALSGDTSSSAESEAKRRSYLLLSIVGLALVLRLYGIALYTLKIDEYGSIQEARSVGLNWNSIVYSSLMHFWIRLGNSELWLRLPSAIFGIATVVILFKIGEKLGGWRTGVVAGLLAATAPFNIHHSQEVRFYSLFICSSAAFMLATISYIDSRRATRDRLTVFLAGLLLLVSHFLGLLGLYAQGAAAMVAANKRWPLRAVLALVFVPLLMFGLPLISVFRNALVHLYQVYGNASGQSLSVTPVSIISFAKIAFAGYVFVFGYHVYPLRLIPVIAGLSLSGFLLGRGALRLWKQRQWRLLPFTYLLAIFGVFIVLDSVGGRLATGVSPRHVAFAWPAFVVLVALGLSSFTRTSFYVLLVALLSINALSLWFGWQRDWSYGAAPDYRSAAQYALRWVEKDMALVPDGWSQDPIDFYFPKGIPLVNSAVYLHGGDLNPLPAYQRLIFITDTWRPDFRRESNQLMEKLREGFTCIDGRVDYPLFEYVLERKSLTQGSGAALTAQVRQPLSIYGQEFQDLNLPVSVEAKKIPLQVIGAYGLPDLEGRSSLTIPLSQPTQAGRLILLTDVVPLDQLQPGQQIAEVIVGNKRGTSETFPLRLGEETDLWDRQCRTGTKCETVYQWHKRMAIVGQNTFPGAWRDFQAGLHGVALDLAPGTEVTTLTLRYVAGSGHLYIWGIALPA